MIRILKRLFEVMIQVGNTIITTLSIGSSTPVKIDWGSDKVWPEATGTYIILPRTGATIASASNYSYISNISASTTAWTVTSSDSSWLTAYRVSGTQARFDVTENTSVGDRTATLSFKIGTTEYATYTVRQMGAAVFIVLAPKLVQLSDGTSRTGTISVSANTTAWTVTSTSSWITAEKYVPYSTPMVRYTLAENSGTTQRTGYIKVSYGSTSAQTQVNQGYGLYVLSALTTNPISLTSGQTNFAISIVSKLGNTPVEPSYSIGYNPQLNVQLISMQTGGTTGQHNYFFSCNSASTTGQTTASIVFTQTASSKSITYVVNQKGKATPTPTGTTISGFTVSRAYGDWQLGKYVTSYTTIGGVNTPIYVMAILNPNNVSGDFTYTLDCDYYTRQGETQTDGTINRTLDFTPQTINIPSGDTAYGITLYGGPNLTITTVRTFTVT